MHKPHLINKLFVLPAFTLAGIAGNCLTLLFIEALDNSDRLAGTQQARPADMGAALNDRDIQ